MPDQGPGRSRREIKALLAQARQAVTVAASILAQQEAARAAVEAAIAASLEAQVCGQMDGMPLASLRGVVPGRVAWGALADAGVGTVGHVHATPRSVLVALDGIGERTATAVKDAADEIHAELLASARPRLDAASADPASRALAGALVRLDRVHARHRRQLPVAGGIDATVPSLVKRARPARWGIAWLVASRARKADAQAAAIALAEAVTAPAVVALVADGATAAADDALSDEEAWQAFLADPARIQSILDAEAGGTSHADGAIDADLLARIDAVALDRSQLSVMLRRYQEFGAKFALAQGRVLLGDDMGLGKGIQALAVMAHLHATSTPEQPRRFLVVAPASVLVNWEREATGKSDVPVHVLHHSRPPGARAAWIQHGGIAITTYEHLASLDLPGHVDLDLLVADEAHYAKNPHAHRSRRVAALASRAQRVLLMTGTPIENHGLEFVELVRLLDPPSADRLLAYSALVSPEEFRRRVAAVYLRRNASDVLAELPALTVIDEWEEMTPHDHAQYRQAVADGNFMAMRRAGFAAASMHASAKLDRLLELTDEARVAGHRVIVYSYFIDVLALVAKALGHAALGPLTGALPPQARQGLIDEFTASPPGTALVAQVVAGGIGLNIQAASVVILCEPQLKPSTEQQAIKRAHRMGQLKPVQVHRLLNPDTVDERILQLLAAKESHFHAYAHHSDLAHAGADALDSRTVLRLIKDERDRLGIPPSQPPPGEQETRS